MIQGRVEDPGVVSAASQQWAKFDAAGGIEWLRGLIDRSKPKVPPDKT